MTPIETLAFDHIDLTVNDLTSSIAFYEKVLGALGFRRMPYEEVVVFASAHTAIGLQPAPEATRGARFDRYRVGLHHLAFRARRREDVDAFHTFLAAERIPILDPPTEYPQYGPGYYAVFFADPDGMKLELVYWPWGYWKRTMTEGRDERARSVP